MTSKPPLRDDEKTPVTRKTSASFDVAERNRIEALLLASLFQSAGESDLAEDARRMALRFERWVAPTLVGREIQPQILDFDDRSRDLSRFSKLCAEAARIRREGRA